MSSGIFEELQWRGLVSDCTDIPALTERLSKGPTVLYCGFDPTADSLHVGSLVPLLALRRFQLFGHHPIAVAGGATGSIGDPSGKTQERQLLSSEILEANIIAVKTVDGVDDAIAHITKYGSQHTDAIITECEATADLFLNRVDSAIVLVNASTQFADGGEFGFGAEIGIATGKMHARGPVGVEQLTSFKYLVRGTGQVRSK